MDVSTKTSKWDYAAAAGAVVGIGVVYLLEYLQDRERKATEKFKRPIFLSAREEEEFTEHFGSVERFHCPISRRLLRDPVRTPAGHVYERAVIKEWIFRNQTDPFTR